jgi:hypothetical protein
MTPTSPTRGKSATVVCLLVLALVAPAAAQQGRRPNPNRGAQEHRGEQQPTGKQPGKMSPGQLHQLFDTMLVMQAQKALSLDDEQYAQFVTRVKNLQEMRRRNQQERVRLMNELQRMTSPRNPEPAPESEITSRLNALQELESRTAADLRRAYDAVDEVLNPVQRARFRVLEEQIERRKLELVGRARSANRPPRR